MVNEAYLNRLNGGYPGACQRMAKCVRSIAVIQSVSG